MACSNVALGGMTSSWRALTTSSSAGLALRMNDRHHYEFGIRLGEHGREVFLRYAIGGIRTIAATAPVDSGRVRLRVRSYPEIYRFSYAVGDHTYIDLGGVETRYLASEVADGFNGVFIGMFATGNGRDSSAPADFDWFEIKPATDGAEGSTITVAAGFDAQRIRLTGNVSGQPPFKGTLRHHGWIATEIRMPAISEALDPRVISPAEVELA